MKNKGIGSNRNKTRYCIPR